MYHLTKVVKNFYQKTNSGTLKKLLARLQKEFTQRWIGS